MSDDRYFALIPCATVFSKELNNLPTSTRWIYVIMVATNRARHIPFTLPYSLIRQITGFSKPTIRLAIKELEQAGFLTYEHGGLEQNPNVYELEISWLKT